MWFWKSSKGRKISEMILVALILFFVSQLKLLPSYNRFTKEKQTHAFRAALVIQESICNKYLIFLFKFAICHQS